MFDGDERYLYYRNEFGPEQLKAFCSVLYHDLCAQATIFVGFKDLNGGEFALNRNDATYYNSRQPNCGRALGFSLGLLRSLRECVFLIRQGSKYSWVDVPEGLLHLHRRLNSISGCAPLPLIWLCTRD